MLTLCTAMRYGHLTAYGASIGWGSLSASQGAVPLRAIPFVVHLLVDLWDACFDPMIRFGPEDGRGEWPPAHTPVPLQHAMAYSCHPSRSSRQACVLCCGDWGDP